MILKNLSKEQKQYAVLGLLAVAILVILMALGIRFSMGTITVAKEELAGLTDNIESAEQALSRSQQTSTEYVKTIGMLKEYLTNAPPERNCYSWATEVIYSKSRLANLEIDSIEELSISQLRKAAPKDSDSPISFESYSVRISAHGGYENTKYFLKLFEQDFPLVRFSGLEISAGKNLDSHDIQLYMQWPYNFGQVTNKWDVVASKALNIAAVNDGQETARPQEPASVPVKKSSPADTSVTQSDPVREPYPPTSRPTAEVVPAPKPVIEAAAAESQPGTHDAVAHVEPPSIEVAPEPAIDDVAQPPLGDTAPPTVAPIEEPPPAITESIVDAQPVSEPETLEVPVADIEPQSVIEPEPVVEPQPEAEAMADPASPSAMDQDLLLLMSAAEKPDAASVSGEPKTEPKADASQMDSASGSNLWSQSQVEPQTVSEASSNDVESVESEQINEETGNKESTRKGTLWGKFFGGDQKGESNEK